MHISGPEPDSARQNISIHVLSLPGQLKFIKFSAYNIYYPIAEKHLQWSHLHYSLISLHRSLLVFTCEQDLKY